MPDDSNGFSQKNYANAKRVVLPFLSRYNISMLPTIEEMNYEEIQNTP